MKAIKVKIKNGMCQTKCEVQTCDTKLGRWPQAAPLINPRVGSHWCQHKCPHFDAYDEGKGTVVLCSHPEQTKGAYVYEKM